MSILCAICSISQNAAGNLSGQLFLVNAVPTCCHSFCRDCVSKKFVKLRQFPCPMCNSIVKQATLTDKSADEATFDRDFRIRRRIKSIYNQPSTAFANDDEFRDYEEMVEDLIYKLVHGGDENELNAVIEQYRIDNLESIAVNQSKKVEEERLMLVAITNEKDSMERTQELFKEEDRKSKEALRANTLRMNTIMLGEEKVGSANETISALIKGAGVKEILADSQGEQDKAVYQSRHSDLVNILLHSRAEPAVTTAGVTVKLESNKLTASEMEKNRAGGYDYSCCFDKGWQEFVSLLC